MSVKSRKVRTREDVDRVLARVRVPPVRVSIKHEGRDGGTYGDSLIESVMPDCTRHALAERLEEMARHIRAQRFGFEIKRATIVIVATRDS